MKLDTFEEVAFTYESIQWTWVDGGVTTSDTWAGRGD
jgi:type VI secretion system secreted protein Hcp